MANTLKNWTIKDSLFYPLGLFNNSSRAKTVFVAWSCNTLLTYIFKKSGSSNSLKDTYKIILEGTIHEIIVTEYNTLCLTKDGYVYYFASCKSLKRLEFLDGVRCITATSNGFAIIKITKENRIVLEIYNDFDDHSNIGQGRRSFDISYDEENLLNSSWKNESFSIYSIKIFPENKQFLEQVSKQKMFGNEFFLFAINNSLFGLTENHLKDENDCAIFLIHTLPSEIEYVRFIKELNVILIFMKCGVLEMIFASKLSKSLDRAVHIIESDMISTTMAENCFFYSDGQRVVKCTLYYDDLKHTISTRKNEKNINGIIALTWVSTMKKLICLSENNIFYRLKFDNNQTQHEDDEFTELTDEKLKEVEARFTRLIKLTDELNIIQEKVKRECQTQEIISISSRKDMYKELVQSKITFYKNLPTLDGLVIYPMNEHVLSKHTYFVLIEVDIKKNAIFRNNLWRLTVELFDSKYVYKSITITPLILENAFQVILQVEKHEILIIPEFRIALAAHVNVGTDFMYIYMPAKINSVDIENLFSPTLRTLVDPNQKTINEKIGLIWKRNSTHTPNSHLQFSSKLKTPLLISLEELYETFRISVPGSMMNLNNSIIVCLLGVEIKINYFETENIIEMTSDDPGALYYAKKILAQKLYNEKHNDEKLELQDELQSLQKLKAELETKNSRMEPHAWANILKKIYSDIRNGTITKL